jgi:hypothetical protein
MSAELLLPEPAGGGDTAPCWPSSAAATFKLIIKEAAARQDCLDVVVRAMRPRLAVTLYVAAADTSVNQRLMMEQAGLARSVL